jgi:hypothetical protein
MAERLNEEASGKIELDGMLSNLQPYIDNVCGVI